jgi:hypothetical protein
VALITHPCSEFDSCDFLFLRQIEELDHNGLRLVLQEGIARAEALSIKVGDTELVGCHRVESTGRLFEVVWRCYVAYSFRNESYARTNDYDVSTGRRFQIYSRSRFLEFIGHATFASEEYPGPIQHIGVGCEDHIIDVVSAEEPSVSALRPDSARLGVAKPRSVC